MFATKQFFYFTTHLFSTYQFSVKISYILTICRKCFDDQLFSQKFYWFIKSFIM